jgi:hypothetical protein
MMEQFDLNDVIAAGKITRLWGRGGDVFARLGVPTNGNLVEKDDTQLIYVTLRFPLGNVGGKPVTLREGDFARVTGFLTQNQIQVSLRRFLDTAGADGFLDSIPQEDRPAWHKIQFSRQSAVLNVLALETLSPAANDVAQVGSQVTLEGIVVRRWDYPRGEQVDRFTRVAMYDRWTRMAEDVVNPANGLPRRMAHYVNVVLPNGEREIEVRRKQRIRVTGALRDRGQRVSLHQAILETGQAELAELIQRCPDVDRLHEISAQWESLHIAAQAMIVYSR